MLDYLDELESEAIYILREVAGQFEKPALLFSGGKDSITLVHLALKAFRPGKFPFPLVHIDTGHNFKEALEYRDRLANRIGEKLIVRNVEDTIRTKSLKEPGGKFSSRNALQTYTLLDTIEEFGFDACIGVPEGMKKKQGPRKEFFLCVMNSVSGIRNGKDPSYGIFIMAKYRKAKMYAYSRSATGRNLIYGIISVVKKLNCQPSTSPTSGMSSRTMGNW